MRVLQLHAGYKTLADNKLYLFSLICVVVTVGFLPVVLPHIMHPYMIYHIILHVASLSVALFLSFISVAAYMKNRSVKLLLMALGFLTLVTGRSCNATFCHWKLEYHHTSSQYRYFPFYTLDYDNPIWCRDIEN